MPQRLFLFLQLEFPWELGPPDGRYLLRAAPGAEPERVVVLGTVGAARRTSARSRRRPGRAQLAEASAEPAPVATARATIVDPVSLSAERQAQAWLSDIDPERETQAAVGVVNRVLHAYRIAAADPYVHEVSAAQALIVRAGWGEGEQVADGRWLYACELPDGADGRFGRRLRAGRRLSAALRPQERLAQLLGARGRSLLCEELALRARLDLDQGRLAHAAIELEAAYAAALRELPAERREDLAARIAELEELHADVARQARTALPDGGAPEAGDGSEASDGSESGGGSESGEGSEHTSGTAPTAGEPESADEEGERTREPAGEPHEETVRHALGRLEAALRARTATGLG
jgi:hypothetical protein